MKRILASLINNEKANTSEPDQLFQHSSTTLPICFSGAGKEDIAVRYRIGARTLSTEREWLRILIRNQAEGATLVGDILCVVASTQRFFI